VPDIWQPDLVAPPSAASGHLSDEDLVSSRSEPGEKHLADCGWCRQRLVSAEAAGALEPDDDEFASALAAGGWRARFARASSNAVIPERVRDLMSAPASIGDAEPGDLWRLSWRGEHLLVAVIDVDGWMTVVAPVTTDAGLADELTLRVAAGQSPLGTELAVWVRSRMPVPLFVFDRPLGALPPVGRDSRPAAVALRQLTRAHLAGSPTPADLPVGRQLTANDTDRVAMHDALREQITWFAGALAGLQQEASLIAGEKRGDARAMALPISDVIRRLAGSMSLAELADRTGLDMGRLVDLSRPGAIATREEAEAIESISGVAIDDSSRRVNAAKALAEASRPTWRPARRRWTQQRHPEADPDDPTSLVTDLIQWRLAARSITTKPEPAAEDQQLQRYWRDQVAMMLQEYR
jgi:hypothetical protein